MADDHAVVRRGLREIILEHPDWSEVAEAGDYRDLFEILDEGSFDALVMDVDMPGGDAIDALGRLERRHPELPVLVLSVHGEEQFGLRMLRAGAKGYLSKDRAPDELMEALGTLVQGRSYVTTGLAEQLAQALGRGSEGPPHEELSDREFQVMRLIASGSSVSEIADELHLSVKTVSTYLSRMLEKLGMSSNAEVTRYALQEGLV